MKQRVKTEIHEQMKNKGKLNSSVDKHLDEFMTGIADSNLLCTYKPSVLKGPINAFYGKAQSTGCI
eukprot:scaffold211659_cov28-Tisochrysis_lutea.AAC.1